jgi:beta-lactam-binding protein with PASTA domain
MVVVLALAFFLSALLTIYTLFRSGDTRVPNVLGKTEAEAQKMAEEAGLKVKIQRRIDPQIPANTVIETRPGPNSSVKKDSSLTIVVSSGPQPKSELSPVPRALRSLRPAHVSRRGGGASARARRLLTSY